MKVFTSTACALVWALTSLHATPAFACTVSDCPSGYNVITGTSGNDTLTGGNQNDCIIGLGGNDTINGGNGHDYLCGNDGDDIINGSNGNDTIYGGAGDDTIDGGNNHDTIDGGAGNDTINGGNGNDHLDGGDGNDTLTGGNGGDAIGGGAGNDTIVGGNGGDSIDGGPGDDDIDGGNGGDAITGGGGNDTIDGGNGGDTCTGTGTIPGCDTVTHATIGYIGSQRGSSGNTLTWDTVSELGTLGFRVERHDASTGRFTPVHVGTIPALPDSDAGGRYSVTDAEGSAETTRYRIVELTSSGIEMPLGPFDLSPTLDPPPARQETSRSPVATSEVSWVTTHFDTLSHRHGSVAKVIVSKTGMQRVSIDLLAETLGREQQDIHDALAAKELRLTHLGTSVAYRVTDAHMEFWGIEPRSNIYDKQSAYLLEVGSGTHITSRSVDTSPADPVKSYRHTSHHEINKFAGTVVPIEQDTEFWFWKVLVPSAPDLQKVDVSSFTSEIDLAGTSQVTVNLHGASPVLHVVSIELNGHELGEVAIKGQQRKTIVLDAPAGLLVEGENNISLSGHDPEDGAVSVVYLDSVSIEYSRKFSRQGEPLLFTPSASGTVTVNDLTSASEVFDLSDEANPVSLDVHLDSTTTKFAVTEGRQYAVLQEDDWNVPGVVPSMSAETIALAAESDGADYVVVTHNSLHDSAGSLASYRESSGHTTMVIDVNDIYDAFGGGQGDPRAIQTFLRHAASTWDIPPRHVILIGGGHFDYRNDRGDTGPNLIPPLLVRTWGGLAPSDWRFVETPDGQDLLNISIGRIAASTNAEVAAVVSKIRAYERDLDESWHRKALVIADQVNTDQEAFVSDSELIESTMSSKHGAALIDANESSLESTRKSILDGINAGAGSVVYVGHGAIDRFSRDGLLLTEDTTALTNIERPTLVIGATCGAARFDFPLRTSLGQALVHHPAGGAVTVLSATGTAHDSETVTITNALFAQAYESVEPQTLGQAILQARTHLKDGGRDVTEALMSFQILGDPALRLPHFEQAAGNSEDADPVNADSSSGGCSASRALPHSGFWISLLIIGALLIRRRRTGYDRPQ